MIVVTGGAGFIGANIIKALNDRGVDDILLVDSLGDGSKVSNLAELRIADFVDKEEFIRRIEASENFGKIDGVLHQGACSDTMITDGDYVLSNNYEFSKSLFHFCTKHDHRFVYASSASVYGAGREFKEDICHERPLNLYAYSKHLFDAYVGRHDAAAVGLRYFNVYGPREFHKQRMASVVLHFSRQLCSGQKIKLFAGSGGYGDGEQRRDFVSVDDVVDVNLHFLFETRNSGVFNVGSGKSRSYNDMAKAVIDAWRSYVDLSGKDSTELIEYIPFPDDLKGKYQSFTEADISRLRQYGYKRPMTELETGVQNYVDWLAAMNFQLSC